MRETGWQLLGLVAVYRLLAFDGLAVLPRQPVSWLLAVLPTRLTFMFASPTSFFDGDASPHALLATTLALAALGPNIVPRRAAVLLAVWLGAWAVQAALLVLHRDVAQAQIVAALGDATLHPGVRSDSLYTLRSHVLNTHGWEEQNRLEPNISVTFKTFDASLGAHACKTLYSALPASRRTRDTAHLSAGRLRLDVYQPSMRNNTGPAPVMVYVHGGAWRHGGVGNLLDNNQGGDLPVHLLKMGVAVVAVSYRFECASGGAPAGELMLEDLGDAVRYVAKHAAEWQLDAQRLCLWGISAGAHLSMSLAYSGRFPEARCVVSFYGPTELREEAILASAAQSWSAYSWIHARVYARQTRFLCPAGGDAAECFRRLSPTALVQAAASAPVPTLLLHGQSDALVPVEHARMLASAFAAHQDAVFALVEVPAAQHNCDLFRSSPCAQAARFALERFLHQALT